MTLLNDGDRAGTRFDRDGEIVEQWDVLTSLAVTSLIG